MDLSALLPEIKSKLEFRNRDMTSISDEFMNKEARLRKLWQSRLAYQMVILPHFNEVSRAVRRTLRMSG